MTHPAHTCFSADYKSFNFIEKNDLLRTLANQFQLVVGQPYWSASYAPITAKSFDVVDEVLETLESRMQDKIGLRSEGLFDVEVAKEQRQALADLIAGWIDEHVPVGNWYNITSEAVEHQVTQADVDTFINPSAID